MERNWIPGNANANAPQVADLVDRLGDDRIFTMDLTDEEAFYAAMAIGAGTLIIRCEYLMHSKHWETLIHNIRFMGRKEWRSTISLKEWQAKVRHDYASIIDGKPYIMRLGSSGTELAQVTVRHEGKAIEVSLNMNDDRFKEPLQGEGQK